MRASASVGADARRASSSLPGSSRYRWHELRDARAHLGIQTCVLDRAGHERRARHEEVDLGLRELARRLGVSRDDADDRLVPREDRHAEQRLEALLFQLRHVLRARIGEQVLAHERRLLALGRPPGEPLASLEDDPVDQVLVGVTGRAQDEPLAAVVEEVHEARVDCARVGEQADNRAQYLVELERRRDGPDDLEQDIGVAVGLGRHRL
jgi:hypothetical protein